MSKDVSLFSKQKKASLIRGFFILTERYLDNRNENVRSLQCFQVVILELHQCLLRSSLMIHAALKTV